MRLQQSHAGDQSIIAGLLVDDPVELRLRTERDQHRPATPAERIPVYQIEVETK